MPMKPALIGCAPGPRKAIISRVFSRRRML